ncbi:MAG: F0F1 ATP synthase subunit epsilon [Acidiferrobacter sp.]
MATLAIDIVSAEQALYSGRATLVVVPLAEGEAGILPGHSPLFGKLRGGALRVTDEGGVEHGFYVSGGFVEVQPDRVTVLADSGVRAADLDCARAQEAVAQAQDALRQSADKIDYARAEAALAAALVQLQVARTLRPRSSPGFPGRTHDAP